MGKDAKGRIFELAKRKIIFDIKIKQTKNMINFKVDQEKCTNCGKCSSDCPVLIINGKTEYPTIKEGKEDNCIKCMHCLAICPEAAISIWDKEPKDSILTNVKMPETDDLESLMQTRRSIRKFKKMEVNKDLLRHIAEMASYAPTAKNENAVQFTLVDNSEDMAALRTLAYEEIKACFEEGRLPQKYQFLNNFRQVWESKQIDVIFRNAPQMLICSAPKDGTLPVVDSTIAMTYFDLLANANGLGTLWDGFAKDAFENIDTNLKERVGIPENHVVVMALMIGYPANHYARSVQNNEPNIKLVSL